MAKLGEKRQAADVVLVAVAEDQRVCRRSACDVRHQAGRRALAKVEDQPFAPSLNRKASRPLFADPGNEP
jgi:hypothetical protein